MNKKRNRKITVPKISQTRSVLYCYERKKHPVPNFSEFLKNQEMQESFLNIKDFLIEDLLSFIWLSRYEERELIENGEIEENHPFFKKILEIMNLNPEAKDEILEFCTLMYFEDNSICEHWNFKEKIDKQKFDNLVFKSLYEDSKCFKLFLENLTNEEFSNIKFISQKNPNKPALDIKCKVMKDVLYSFGGTRAGHKKLLGLINDNLNVVPDYNALLQHLDKDSILYYPLQHLNMPDFNKTLIDHDFNGIKMTTSIENLAKYNSMDKGLSECMARKYGYGLDGKTYGIERFGDLVNLFAQDPFLRTVIANYLKIKADKAVKKENRTNWQYYAVLFSFEKEGESGSNGSKTNSRKTKI